MRQYLDPTIVFNYKLPAGRLAYLLGWIYVWCILLFFLVLFWISLGPSFRYSDGLVAFSSDILVRFGGMFLVLLLSLRRLRDLNDSGWYVLLGYIPLISFFFLLYLLLAPGRTPAALVARGDNRAAKGDHTGAIALYDRAINSHDDNDIAWLRRASAHAKIGKHRTAIADYDKALMLKPSADGFHGRALAHAHLGEYDDAITDFGRAIALDPTNAAVYYSRAVMHDKMGATAEAIKDYSYARELDPTNSEGYSDLRSAPV